MAGADKRGPVGVIGLGLLGGAIVRRLLSAGYAVSGCDLDREKAASLASAGLQASDVAAIAQRCERIVLAVFTSAQVGAVAAQLYATGALRLLICTTTCDPVGSIAHGASALAQGWRYVEAPLSGTSAQVTAGDGVGLIAGEATAIDEAADLFDAICPRWHRVGAVGDAGRAKLAVNLILGLNRLALAEGLVFAQRQGLDGAAFLDIVRDSAAYSQVMDTKGAKMLQRDFSAEGRAEQTLKDVKMMQAEAERLGQPLPLLAVHQAVLEACVGHGEGMLDSSVVIEEIRRRGNEKESH
ncbi:MAG: 6-phosphogluconate dehydrogenase [Bradyrhizobium sp.]|nr:6-phosphogluconate dehydrogenase [Bradyrhizobium sp.]